ncbi:basement membrane-specific heparan sulfate proteoglycan core protein-like isoform X2 [Dysidea avara]|uniref:basement membrane-specific heparan sulfate proteoglycan core protein-like isoform X2 n=1 Tax=Dysidea avara TaxID=196820 RepID=UPI0033338667
MKFLGMVKSEIKILLICHCALIAGETADQELVSATKEIASAPEGSGIIIDDSTTDDNFVISINPQNMVVAKGDNVIINITIRGLNSDNYTYHWRRLNGSLPVTASGGNTPNLNINSVSPSDSGSYYCVLESYLGDSVESDRATLQVFYITSQPENQVVAVGQEVLLTCDAVGADKLKYTWIRKWHKRISSQATGINTNHLAINNISTDDSGQYKCIVLGGNSCTKSKPVNVTVLALPVVTTHPNSNGPITVAEGGDVMLSCEATGEGTLNYQWRRLSGSPPDNVQGNNTTNLTISKITVSDSGEYYCVVNNGGTGVSSQEVQVTVKRRPAIVNNMVDKELSIVSGSEELLLTCEFSGDDISGVYWERLNDRPLASKNNISQFNNDKTKLVLTITEARSHHSGLYRCVVYSPWGVAQSRDVHVTITVAPPTITEQPSSKTIVALNDVTFTCKARGFKVKYEWRRSNDSHVIGRQSSLTILSATPLDGNGYYCVAYCSTQHHYASSNIAILKVLDYIAITHQPESVKVAINGLASLRVVASGPASSHFTYKWMKFGSSSLPSSASGGNTPHLHFTSVTPSDSGIYYCIVANQWGRKVSSNYGKVDVLWLRLYPSSVTVSKGSNVSLKCSSGSIQNIPILWNMHNQSVIRTMDPMINLTNINMVENGQYQCTANVGNVDIKSNLASIAVFDIAEKPHDTIATVGSSVVFNCSASVTNGVSCKWKHNYTEINSAGNGLSLKLPNVGINDDGLYTCEMKGNTGKLLARTARLTVLYILSHPVDISVATGSSANFTCEASIPYSVTYQWKHNNTLLKNQTSTVLNIRNVQMSSIGEYYCIVAAKNNATVVSDVARLTVHEGDGKVKQRSHATIVAYYSLGGVLLAVIVIICVFSCCCCCYSYHVHYHIKQKTHNEVTTTSKHSLSEKSVGIKIDGDETMIEISTSNNQSIMDIIYTMQPEILDLINMEELFVYLIKYSILTKNEVQHVGPMSRETNIEKATFLLSALYGKGPEGQKDFIKALYESNKVAGNTGHQELIRKLHDKGVVITEQRACTIK